LFFSLPKPSRKSQQCQSTYALAAALLGLWLGACSSQPDLPTFAREHKLRSGAVHTEAFSLVTLSRTPVEPGTELRVYLGGDGRPWRGTRPAKDPNGGLLALELMIQDPAASLYLGRPCYHTTPMPANCTPELWTSARYSKAVVAAVVQALNQLVKEYQASRLTLMGHSGGGVIALLVAPHLSLPTVVVTVAANLDTDAWTEFHHHLPLYNSINPQSLPTRPEAGRRIHLLGLSDNVVPPQTVDGYINSHPQEEYYYFDEFDHRCCWLQHWPEILQQIAPAAASAREGASPQPTATPARP
jgi:hypothetical protein